MADSSISAARQATSCSTTSRRRYATYSSDVHSARLVAPSKLLRGTRCTNTDSLRTSRRLRNCRSAPGAWNDGADSVTESQISPHGRQAHHDIDAEKDWPVKIHKFNTKWEWGARRGILFGTMTYDAYHASMTPTVMILPPDHGSAYYPPVAAVEQHPDSWGYKGNQFDWNWEVLVRSSCGSATQSKIAFNAWWNGMSADGKIVLDDDPQEWTVMSEQGPCPEVTVEEPAESSGPSDGGSGGACPLCVDRPVQYTHCMVKYTYDVDTGEIYTWDILYCY